MIKLILWKGKVVPTAYLEGIWQSGGIAPSFLTWWR